MSGKIIKSEQEWKQLLSPEQFDVTRRKGTERAFSGAYWDNHEAGVYRCVCCGAELFSSAHKFDSGTGWPSFWQPIARENVTQVVPQQGGYKVSCALCEAHLGHVFNDGPQPTGLRYCMDGVAMRFIAWPSA